MKIMLLNGPNLNRLGVREPDIYGVSTLSDIQNSLQPLLGSEDTLDFRQTNHEGELVTWVHEAVDHGAHVIINPGAFTHYSYALRDACAMVSQAGLKLIEIHLSNPHTREEFRHHSVISGVATGIIAGFGANSYRLALRSLLEQ